MGKWCEVKCNCSNRQPLSGSEWWDYNSYERNVKKPRLAKTQDEWEKNIKGMYECGHRDGAFTQLWQGDILKFGYALEKVFQKQINQFMIFRRISDWRNYVDEYLALTVDEAIAWQIEIEQLRLFMSDEEFLGWHEKEIFDKELTNTELLYGNINETLNDAKRLCEASLLTQNPIEFDW